MHREKYEDLLLRFTKELHDIDVSRDLMRQIEDQYTRHPNVAACSGEEVTDRFAYRHG